MTMFSTFYTVDSNAKNPLGHLTFPYDSIATHLDKAFIVIDIEVVVLHQTSDIWNMNSLEFSIYNRDQKVKTNFVRLNNKIGSGK